ncbi:MAG TPA: ECF-type sigma factor [Steroidobacteraceae bacterium]|nr:ECF-type sigma factor [Steroidobacteraceae bacterium]
MKNITELLENADIDGPPSKSALFTSLYQELRQLASSRLKRSGKVTMLDTTSLVHESYLRFLKAGDLEARDRARFLAYSARVMRSVIVDFVRESRAARRGGEAVHVTLNTDISDSLSGGNLEVVRVDEALDVLAKTDERLVRLVEMKYFAGYTDRDIAECLDTSERSLRRDCCSTRR